MTGEEIYNKLVNALNDASYIVTINDCVLWTTFYEGFPSFKNADPLQPVFAFLDASQVDKPLVILSKDIFEAAEIVNGNVILSWPGEQDDTYYENDLVVRFFKREVIPTPAQDKQLCLFT